MLDVVDLSRLQFALTALYHFIFVPLTLGLSFVLVIMETIYVKTGKEVYKDMTKLIHIKFCIFCSKWKNLSITRKLYLKKMDKIITRQGCKILLFFSLIIFGKICRDLQ